MNGNRDIKPMSWARKSEIATIMQQADGATKATSKDIPDLEGAELKL